MAGEEGEVVVAADREKTHEQEAEVEQEAVVAEICQMLLDAGASVTAVDGEGQTPLDIIMRRQGARERRAMGVLLYAAAEAAAAAAARAAGDTHLHAHATLRRAQHEPWQ